MIQAQIHVQIIQLTNALEQLIILFAVFVQLTPFLMQIITVMIPTTLPMYQVYFDNYINYSIFRIKGRMFELKCLIL